MEIQQRYETLQDWLNCRLDFWEQWRRRIQKNFAGIREIAFERKSFNWYYSKTLQVKLFPRSFLTRKCLLPWAICQILIAYLGFRNSSICLVCLCLAGAKDWTSYARNQKRRPLFLPSLPKHDVLDTCPLQCENQFRGSFGHTLKIAHFWSTFGGNKQIFINTLREEVHICIQYVSIQLAYIGHVYEACSQVLSTIFVKKYNCTSTDGVWGSSDAQTVWKASWQESCHGLPCYVHLPVCPAPQYQQHIQK